MNRIRSLAEQHRIVAKVDELMALCDRLEEARKTREEVRDKLTAASLARLTAPDISGEEFPTHAAFALEALPALTTRPDQIKTLRQTILNLAVRGKLVAQDPADEPASNLTKVAKDLQSEEGVKVKADPIQPSDVPFKAPSGWLWTRVGTIAMQTGSGSTPRGGKSAYADEGTPFLRSQNIYDDGLRLDDVVFINDETNKKMKRTQVKAKDLLLNITGGSIGRCTRVPDEFTGANVSQHVAIVRTAAPGTEDYLHLLVRSPFFQGYVVGEQTGAGRGGLPKNRMDRIPVPLPPLAEQRRILAKVDALMVLCDRMEIGLTADTTTRARLLEALLHDALDPATETLEAAE
jgi:type I restriction enzyme S subunit